MFIVQVSQEDVTVDFKLVRVDLVEKLNGLKRAHIRDTRGPDELAV